MSIGAGEIVEVGYVVHDIEAVARRLHASVGVGPFFLYEDIEMHNVRFRGQSAPVPIDIAMGAKGDMVIELIRACDDAPSPFQVREMVFNHWSVFAADFGVEANRLTASGFSEVFSAEIAGDAGEDNARLAYFETPDLAGTYYEIMEMEPAHLLRSYQRVIDAGKETDGREAVFRGMVRS